MVRGENVERKIKMRIILAISILFFVLILICVFLNNYNYTQSQVKNQDKRTEIYIHTYSGEKYYARGNMEILENGKDDSETLIELRGNIEHQGKSNRKPSSETSSGNEKATSLIVYMKDETYAFYGNEFTYVKKDEDKNRIEMYGFLEGYSDGENNYST